MDEPAILILYVLVLWGYYWATLQRVRNVGYRKGVWPTILYGTLPVAPLVLSSRSTGAKGPPRA